MDENNFKFVLKVFIVILIIFALIVFVNTSGLDLNNTNTNKKLVNVVTIEGMNNPILLNSNDAFCESHRGSSNILEKSCEKLTQHNCNSTSCCVWTSDNKCLAGSAKGPTFNTDENGKTKNLDYYYYQNKCYGTKCA
jgi:hypothetical protein